LKTRLIALVCTTTIIKYMLCNIIKTHIILYNILYNDNNIIL